MVEINRTNIMGFIIGGIIIVIALILFFLKVSFIDVYILYFICGLAVVIMMFPFFIGLLAESRTDKEKEEMFLEFSRDLAEGVKSGTPINKSILNVRNKDYSSLNPHIAKLINQVSLGIPVKDALEVFSRDIGNPVISRAVGLIKEAETSGGRIELILESVTSSMTQVEKLRKERKAAVYNLTVQGYIIFILFIIIMLVMQFRIIPLVSNLEIQDASGSLGSTDLLGTGNMGSGVKLDAEQFTKPFLFLLLTQGFFSGLVIGKVSEGSVKSGLKHSFALVALALLVSTGAKAFF